MYSIILTQQVDQNKYWFSHDTFQLTVGPFDALEATYKWLKHRGFSQVLAGACEKGKISARIERNYVPHKI